MASNVASGAARRLVGKLRPESTALLVCDMQELFRPRAHYYDTILRTAQYMTSTAKTLNIPIVVTQQYTKVFGPTCPEVFADSKDLEAASVFEKKKFSMCTQEVQDKLDKLDKQSFIMVGIEAHVCVQQVKNIILLCLFCFFAALHHYLLEYVL
jgi:nicotinamidase-related amidase